MAGRGVGAVADALPAGGDGVVLFQTGSGSGASAGLSAAGHVGSAAGVAAAGVGRGQRSQYRAGEWVGGPGVSDDGRAVVHGFAGGRG